MGDTTCFTIAGHQLPQGFDVHPESGSESRETGGGRKRLAALPEAHGGLDDTDLRSHLGLSLWSLAKYFTKQHAPYLANHLVASIAIYLYSECLEFSDIFRAELKRSKLTHSAFAERVGVTAAFVSLVATNRAKMPMDRAGKWADTLGLTGAERRWFLMYAGLAYIPDEDIRGAIADELEALRAKVLEQTDENRALAERIRSLLEHVRRRR